MLYILIIEITWNYKYCIYKHDRYASYCSIHRSRPITSNHLPSASRLWPSLPDFQWSSTRNGSMAVGWLVGWSVGRSVGRSVGWLVGWLVFDVCNQGMWGMWSTSQVWNSWLHFYKVFPYLKLWKIPSHQPQPAAPLSSAPLARRQSPDMVIIAFTKEMTTFGTLSLNMSVSIFQIVTSPNSCKTENIKHLSPM